MDQFLIEKRIDHIVLHFLRFDGKIVLYDQSRSVKFLLIDQCVTKVHFCIFLVIYPHILIYFNNCPFRSTFLGIKYMTNSVLLPKTDNIGCISKCKMHSDQNCQFVYFFHKFGHKHHKSFMKIYILG